MNVVFIFTDQQSRDMMSCAGNGDLHTPALDALAARGTRFDRAYCAQPLCVPSRGAMFTGMYPHEFGVTANDDVAENSAVAPAWLACTLRDAGLRTTYIGKWHLPIAIDDARTHGFEQVIESLDAGIPDIFRANLQNEAPFFTVVSLTNPHDICAMPFKSNRRLANGPLHGPPPLDACPALPPNFNPAEDEPEVLRAIRQTQPSADWSDNDWRVYRWAYARLTERVDVEIGKVLDAIEASGAARDTVVIFSSDHGEGAGSHRWVKKNALYDESAGVPLIVADPRNSRRGDVDDSHLIGTGLDLFPTICDYAGVAAPSHLRGRALRPLCDNPNTPWRDHLVVETRMSAQPDSATGRAMHTERHKYTAYSRGAHREILIDLKADPHETHNLAAAPEHQDVLAQHRAALGAWCELTNDTTWTTTKD